MNGPRRPWWVIGVVVAYVLLFGGAIATTFVESQQDVESWAYVGIFTFIILLAQLAMLMVPVQLARGRPITRRGLWIPLLGSGFLLALLVLGGGMAMLELFRAKEGWLVWSVAGVAGAYWVCWCILFWLMSGRRTPGVLGVWLHRWLLAGSALELLVAVSAHIIVRRRGECCAGMMTGFGIMCGIAVALAAFGPAVALLYIARWQRIQIPKAGDSRGFEVVVMHPPDAPPKELPKP